MENGKGRKEGMGQRWGGQLWFKDEKELLAIFVPLPNPYVLLFPFPFFVPFIHYSCPRTFSVILLSIYSHFLVYLGFCPVILALQRIWVGGVGGQASARFSNDLKTAYCRTFLEKKLFFLVSVQGHFLPVNLAGILCFLHGMEATGILARSLLHCLWSLSCLQIRHHVVDMLYWNFTLSSNRYS